MGTLFQKEASKRFLRETQEAQRREANNDKPKADDSKPREMAVRARNASRTLQNLSSEQRQQLLHKIADNLEAKEEEIMAENDKDCQVGQLRCACHSFIVADIMFLCWVLYILSTPYGVLCETQWRYCAAAAVNRHYH